MDEREDYVGMQIECSEESIQRFFEEGSQAAKKIAEIVGDKAFDKLYDICQKLFEKADSYEGNISDLFEEAKGLALTRVKAVAVAGALQEALATHDFTQIDAYIISELSDIDLSEEIDFTIQDISDCCEMCYGVDLRFIVD